MKTIDYVTCLNEMYQSQGFPPYKWSEFDSTPFCPFDKPLGEARLALVSSAGVFRDDQKPFDPWAVNDLSFRQIPVDTRRENLKLHHNYFDHRDAVRDLNCVFPVQRLKELEAQRHIGALVPEAISLGMGRLYKRTALQKETMPKIAEVLKGIRPFVSFVFAFRGLSWNLPSTLTARRGTTPGSPARASTS